MSSKRYTDEFRAEAVKQVLERGFTVVDVAARIGIPKHTLYDWVEGEEGREGRRRLCVGGDRLGGRYAASRPSSGA